MNSIEQRFHLRLSYFTFRVRRTALIGVDPGGQQQPVLVIEPEDFAATAIDEGQNLIDEIRKIVAAHLTTQPIDTFLTHKELPVDIRHNSKIFHEKLAVWAADESRRP